MTLFTLHYRKPICYWEGVTILKQLTGLEYTLCPSSLFNTAYVQGAGRGDPRPPPVLRVTLNSMRKS
eukprot:scaffold67520_cov64-Attheya_sp.AAC.1